MRKVVTTCHPFPLVDAKSAEVESGSAKQSIRVARRARLTVSRQSDYAIEPLSGSTGGLVDLRRAGSGRGHVATEVRPLRGA